MDEFTEVGTQTPMMVFNKRLAQVTQKYVREHKPYDEQCARLDFRDHCENLEKESERRWGYVKYGEINVDVDKFDFEKYGKQDRFELLEDQEDFLDKAEKAHLAVGTKMQIVSGHTLSYKCKNRGHGIAVFVPIEDYEMRMSKKKSKSE